MRTKELETPRASYFPESRVASPVTMITIIVKRLQASRSHVRIDHSDSSHETPLKKKKKKKRTVLIISYVASTLYEFLRSFELTRCDMCILRTL